MRTCTPQQSHSMGNGGASEALTYVRKGVAVNPKVLRQYAVDCDRMAKECRDLFTNGGSDRACSRVPGRRRRDRKRFQSREKAQAGAKVRRSPGSRSADQASRCNAQRTPFFVGALIPAQS